MAGKSAHPLPRLLLLPGLDGSGVLFDSLVDALGDQAKTQILTYPPDRALDYQGLAEHLLPELPRSGDYVLVAESFSGPLAILLAAQAVHKPEALTLAATFVRNPFPLVGAMVQAMAPGFLKSKPLPVLEAVLLRPGDHIMTLRVFDIISDIKSDILMSRIKSVLACDMRKTLAALDLPILYLQGRQDRLISPACGALMQKTAKNLRIAKVDTPHFVLQYEAPTTVRDIILPFLNSLA